MDDAVDVFTIVVADLRRAAAEITALVAHRFQIAAGREGWSGAGHDHAAQILIGVDGVGGGAKPRAVSWLAERIARIRTVDGETRNEPVDFKDQIVIDHVVIPRLSP